MMIKQIIIMRKDLNMRKGKIAAQAGHACLAATAKAAAKQEHSISYDFEQHKCVTIGQQAYLFLQDWFDNSYTKICLYVNSEDELIDINKQIEEAGFVTALIRDNGTTEFNGIPTLTCLAVEPLPAELIDPITGNLPLY